MGAVQVLQPRRSATVVAPTLLAAVVVLVGGLALGIGTQVLQGVLPGSWGVIANSGTAWALGAFAVGALLPSDRAAAIGGAAAMVLASVSYHAAVDWFEGSSSNGRSALIWSIAGLVAGSAFGLAGRWCRTRPERRWLALAPVAGVLLGEGLHLVRYVGVSDLRTAGVVELVMGGVLSVVCVARDRRPLVVVTLVVGSFVIHRLALGLIGAGFSRPR